MAFNTGNPLGSKDVKDLFDNAENLDSALNSVANTWTDRLGVVRTTVDKALRDIGFEVLGDYAASIQITSFTQVVRESGEFYRLKASETLPYTTTGTWGGDDENRFVSVGDAVLRGDLIAAGGVSLVGNAAITFDNVASMVAATWLTVGQKVRTLGYYAPGDGGGNDYEIVAAATGTDDGGSFIDLTGISGQAKGLFNKTVHLAKFGVVGDGVADDSVAVQNAINWLPSGYELTAIGLDIDLKSKVTVTNKTRFRLRDGMWKWDHTGTNLIELVGTLIRPQFWNMRIYGTGSAFVSRGAIGCASGLVTEDWEVLGCEFDNIPFGVYFNADTSGSHKNPKCINSTFRNIVRDTTSDASGIGNGLVFAHQNYGITGGKSVGNTFEKCGRHSLYITSGGNVDSINDTFVEHRNDGSAFIINDLAALHIARNVRNVNIVAPRFVKCADLALAIQGVQTGAAQTFGKGVRVISPIFDGNKRGDAIINNDSPSVNGWVDNVTMSDITIKQYGLDSTARVIVFAGKNILVENITVDADLSQGASELVNVVRVEDTATVSEFDKVTIRGIRGVDAGTSSRGVAVDAGVLTGTFDLRLEDIDFGTSSKIFESGTVPVNANYLKLSRGKPVLFSAFTGSFTNQNAEINRVDKYAGKKIFSLSGGLVKPLYATGSSPTSTWVDGAGTVVHTPV